MHLEQASRRFLNLQRRLRKSVTHVFARHATSLLDEPVTEQSIVGSVISRDMAFLIDPIIAHALRLGKEKTMYPALPSQAEAERRGFKLDAAAIKKEINRLLVQGLVQISKVDVYRGVGDKLCFSPALQMSLFTALTDDSKSMIQNYLITRAAQAGLPTTGPSGTVATEAPSVTTQQSKSASPSRARIASLLEENSRLRLEAKSSKRRKLDEAGNAQEIAQVTKACERRLTEATQKLAASRKSEQRILQRAWRAEKRVHRSAEKKMPGLTAGRKPIEVTNVCFDPNCQREAGQKRKRDPTLAFEFAWVMIKGTKEPNPNSGGLRWTVEARVDEFLNFVGSGVDSARRAVLIRERFLHQRALRVFVVPIGRKGCLRRNVLLTSKQKKARAVNNVTKESQLLASNQAKDNEITAAEKALKYKRPLERVRLFDSPSPRTTYGVIIPACQLLFSRHVRKILDAENTESIGICPDGCHSKKFGFMGASVSAFQSNVDFQDPFGGKLYSIVCYHFQLPLMQSVNKKTKELKDLAGNIFVPEAAHNLVKALYVGNVAGPVLKRPQLLVLVGDGATENCGLGDTLLARESFCSQGSLYSSIMISQQAWPAVIKEAGKAGLQEPLDVFFGNEGVKWPGAGGVQAREADAAPSGCGDGTAADDLLPNPLPLDVPLDTTGPVYKDPAVVEELLTYQKEETAKVVSGARAATLRELKEAIDAGPGSPAAVRPVYGPFQSKQHKEAAEAKAHAAHLRESEFQRRLWESRKKSLRLYEERIEELQRMRVGQAQTSTVPPVSMELNPLRFLPCRCGPDGGQLGEARHCSCHRIHNLTNDFVKSLNRGFLEQGVSASKYFNSDYHWADFRAAINFLLVPSERASIANQNDFYQLVLDLVLEVMQLETLIEQCAFDINRGATPPVTAALTRWQTALEATAYLYRHCPLLAFAVIKRCANGVEVNKIRAAADCLKPCGFVSSEHQKIQLEAHAELPFALLTNTSDIIQLAICNAVHELVGKPLLTAVSSDNECGYSLGMGLGSMIRCILLVLRRDVVCRAFPHRCWGLDWNWRITLAFRTHGAECEPGPSVLLLNPNCEAKVRRRFCDFPVFAAAMDDAAKAVPRLLHTLRILAGRPGEMLPEDSLKLWEKAHPKHVVGVVGWNSVPARISQGQWLAIQVFEDCVAAITKRNCGMHRELYGASGFIANMGMAIKSILQYSIRLADGKNIRSSVVIPGPLARSNAANAFVMGRDLLAHYRNKGISTEDVLKRLPTYCGTWSQEGMQQLLQYIRQRHGREPSENGATVMDSRGQIDLEAHKELKLPLSCFHIPDKCSRQAKSILNNSKKVESSFSPLTVIGRSKGHALFPFLSMLYRRHNWNTAGMDPRRLILQDKDLYWEAQLLAQHHGWKTWVNRRDEIKGDLMKDAAIASKLLVSVRQGGDYANTRHGGSSRTNKYRQPKGGAGKRCSAIERGGASAARRGGVADAGRGGASGGGQGGKRAREESDAYAPEHCIDGGAEPAQKTKRSRVPAANRTLAQNLDGNPEPQRSIFALRCLSRKRSAAESEHRKARIERLQRERAEKQAALAEADPSDLASARQASPVAGEGLQNPAQQDQAGQSDSSCTGSASASESNDDSDYEAPGDGTTSNQDCSRRSIPRASKRARPCPSKKLSNAAKHSRRNGESWRRDGGLGLSGARRGYNARGGQRVKPVCEMGGPSQGQNEGDSSCESSSASSEEESVEDADSDDSNVPLARRRAGRAARSGMVSIAGPAGIRSTAVADEGAGIGDGAEPDLDVCLAFRASMFAVSIGSKVEIKWDPLLWAKETDGWCPGVVTGISDGKLRAPNQQKRGKATVKRGFSIVQYEGGEQIVHLLDRAHHYTIMGDKVHAWRLVSGQDNAGNAQQGAGEAKQGRGRGHQEKAQRAAATGEGRGERACKANHQQARSMDGGAETDDDDALLFPEGIAGNTGWDQTADHSDQSAIPVATTETIALPSSGAREPAIQHSPNRFTGSVKNVWSMSFCSEVFRKISPANIRPSIARWSTSCVGYSITRQMPATGEFSPEANIRFSVQLDSRMYFIAYTVDTGVMLFNVRQIRRPRGTDWSQTLRGYPVFTTAEALNRVDAVTDTRYRGAAPSLGASTLKFIAAQDETRNRKTYHCSDVLRWLDVRCLVGAVRWATVGERADGYLPGTFKACPKQTDLIYVAEAFSAPET